MKAATARCMTYLTQTAYVGATKDITTLVQRWLKDSTQAGASTQSATQRFQQLLKNAAGL